MTHGDDLPREARSGPIFNPNWGTRAYAAYRANTTGLDALLAMVLPEDGKPEDDRAALARRRERVEARYRMAWRIDVGWAMLTWQVAMRVAAVEVYLQDALTFLAVYDPVFIRERKSEQTWSYDDVRVASDHDDVLWTCCARWARAFVEDGGPKRWGPALERSGLGRYEDGDIATLEAMWGFRHLRIHNAGRLTREFANRHQSVAENLTRRDLQIPWLRAWAAAADAFVAAAEHGIAGRLRARLGPRLISERERIERERQHAMLHDRMRRGLLARFPEEAARIERAWADPDEDVSRALLQELVTRDLGLGADPATEDAMAADAQAKPDDDATTADAAQSE